MRYQLSIESVTIVYGKKKRVCISTTDGPDVVITQSSCVERSYPEALVYAMENTDPEQLVKDEISNNVRRCKRALSLMNKYDSSRGVVEKDLLWWESLTESAKKKMGEDFVRAAAASIAQKRGEALFDKIYNADFGAIRMYRSAGEIV